MPNHSNEILWTYLLIYIRTSRFCRVLRLGNVGIAALVTAQVAEILDPLLTLQPCTPPAFELLITIREAVQCFT